VGDEVEPFFRQETAADVVLVAFEDVVFEVDEFAQDTESDGLLDVLVFVVTGNELADAVQVGRVQLFQNFFILTEDFSL